jgi:hypothetical protein
MVVSPNTTLTLESVPGQMAGAAGGALQTAQRIGAAMGTALLATVYYHVLTSSRLDFGAAVSDALLCAAGLMLLALLIAVAELTGRRRREPARTAADDATRDGDATTGSRLHAGSPAGSTDRAPAETEPATHASPAP